jgi:heme-degrading monooxygenase HmoA
MRAFMTTGTAHFLKDITAKHQKKDFYFMKSGMSTLVYYEDDKKKSIFVSGRTYDIIHEIGGIKHTGFVIMHHIPVSEEEMPLFEERTKRLLTSIQQTNGVQSGKLLRQDKSNQYVVMMQWPTERDYTLWQKQADHELAFSKNMKLPAYFMDRPFTNSYQMLQEKEE